MKFAVFLMVIHGAVLSAAVRHGGAAMKKEPLLERKGQSASINSSDLHATWLPNSYESSTQSSMLSMIAGLKKKGVNRVYVDVWNQGKVYFQSPTMETLVSSGGVADDHLLWALQAAKIVGDIDVYAWFEYGLMPSYGGINNEFAEEAEARGWVLGQYSGFYWLDCANIDVLSFLSGILNDAMYGVASTGDTYAALGLKGIQLDDHFASPVDLGRTATDMDAAISYIRSAYNGTLSLSPSVLSTSVLTYNVDWNAWGSDNQYDEVIPQIYRTTFESFQSEFSSYSSILSADTADKWIASGIRVDGSGAPTPWSDVSEMIDLCEQAGQGASVWYAHGILDLYPEEFTALWG